MKDSIIFVSDLCPDCRALIEEYKEHPEKFADSEFVNITSSMASLKLFLKYRDELDGYKDAKDNYRVGVPSRVIGESEVEFL